jgi:hypothetical protein
MKLLNFVRWAHDGDRAVEDYRNDFKSTAWASHSRNLLSDQILDTWIMNEQEEISNKPGILKFKYNSSSYSYLKYIQADLKDLNLNSMSGLLVWMKNFKIKLP